MLCVVTKQQSLKVADTSQQEPDFTIVVGGSSRGADVLVEKSNYLFNKDGKPSKKGIQRKIQDYGLAPAYRTKQTTNKYLRQLLCLPFLPAEHIQPIFKDIRDLLQPSHPEGLHKLLQYIDDNWINGPTFKIANWTVYGQPIRTNNDTEGWHHYLNTLCKGLGRENVNLYQLIEVLHKESQMVTTQAQLVTDEKLQRYQRTTYRQYQQQIFQIWDDYRTKKITAKTLLQRASHFHKPAEITENESNNDNV